MVKDTYTIIINGTQGVLSVSEEPFCTLGEKHFSIRRRMNKMSWGFVDFDYDVHGPDGIIANGGVSVHDGIGVYVSDGRGWGIDRIGEETYQLGEQTTFMVDKLTRTITVDTTETNERLPHIICGVMLIADPQKRWEEKYF